MEKKEEKTEQKEEEKTVQEKEEKTAEQEEKKEEEKEERAGKTAGDVQENGKEKQGRDVETIVDDDSAQKTPPSPVTVSDSMETSEPKSADSVLKGEEGQSNQTVVGTQ